MGGENFLEICFAPQGVDDPGIFLTWTNSTDIYGGVS